MTYCYIPLESLPNQSFSTTIPINGENKRLELAFTWNEKAGYWVMGIFDPKNGAAILDGIPLLPGEYPTDDLLGQYPHLGLGSCAIVPRSREVTEPTADNLEKFVLRWGDTVEGID